MPTSVGFIAGEFRYKDKFKVGEHGVVLVGEIEQGHIAPRMMMSFDGDRQVPILGVEGYGKGTEDFGLLFVESTIKDCLPTPGQTYFVTQNIPIAKSREESTFNLTAELLSMAATL